MHSIETQCNGKDQNYPDNSTIFSTLSILAAAKEQLSKYECMSVCPFVCPSVRNQVEIEVCMKVPECSSRFREASGNESF